MTCIHWEARVRTGPLSRLPPCFVIMLLSSIYYFNCIIIVCFFVHVLFYMFCYFFSPGSLLAAPWPPLGLPRSTAGLRIPIYIYIYIYI